MKTINALRTWQGEKINIIRWQSSSTTRLQSVLLYATVNAEPKSANRNKKAPPWKQQYRNNCHDIIPRKKSGKEGERV